MFQSFLLSLVTADKAEKIQIYDKCLGPESGSVDTNSLPTARHHQPPLLHQPEDGEESGGPVHLHFGVLNSQFIAGQILSAKRP